MAKSFSELQTLAIQIRDELNKKKNSAQRVGSALLDIIDNCIQNITDIKQKLSVFEHACSGFKRVSSEAQLPVTPSQEDLAKGFLVNTSLYLYVGTGGNAVNGRYFNVGDIRGPQGEPGSKGETGNTGPTGEKGEQGNSGVTGDTSDIVVINNLDGGESEEGSIKVLAAEQGKVLNKKYTELIIECSQLYDLLDKTTQKGEGSESVVFLDSIVELKTEHSYRICLSGSIISGSLYLYEDADKTGNYKKVKDLHSNEVVDLTNEKGYVRMTLRTNTGESLTSYIYQLDSYNFVPKKDYNKKQEELSVLQCNKHIEYQGLVGGGDSSVLQYKFYTELLKDRPYLLKSDIPISGTVYLYSDKIFSSEPATLGRIENFNEILIKPSSNGWLKITTKITLGTFNAINLYTDKSMLNAGDSLTFGSGNNDTGMIRENSWTYKLAREIDYTAINVGYPGDPIDRILARCNILPYYFSEKFTIPANGDRVSIGTYKSPYIKTFDKDATSMFGQFAKSITDYAGRSNPCFILREKKMIPIEIAVDTSSDNLYVKRLDKGNSLEINSGDVFYTASLFSKDADIVTAWIGTNSLSIYGNALVDYYKLIERFYNKSDLLIIGNHMFNDLLNAQETEKALTKAFGAKYFNLRKYLIEDALSDAGLVASEEDLQDIAAGKCPRQLLFDGTHFKQIGHDLIKEQVLLRFKLLGYIN